jgi:hypothetical protein
MANQSVVDGKRRPWGRVIEPTGARKRPIGNHLTTNVAETPARNNRKNGRFLGEA